MGNAHPYRIRRGNDVEFIITLDRENGAAQSFRELSGVSVSVYSTAQHITAGYCELEPLSPSDPYTLRAFYRVSLPQFLGPVDVVVSGSLDGRAFKLSHTVFEFVATSSEESRPRFTTIRIFYYLDLHSIK